MKKVSVLLLSLMFTNPSFAYYEEYGYDTDYSTDTIESGYDSYGTDDVYEKTSYVKKTTSLKPVKSLSTSGYIKTGAVMSNLLYKFNNGKDKYSTYGLVTGLGIKMNNEFTADVTAILLSDVVSTEKNIVKNEEDLLVFSNKSLFVNAAYNFAMSNEFIPYVTAGVGMVHRKIEGDSVDINSRVKKEKKDSDGNYTGIFEDATIKEQAYSIKSVDSSFAYQFGAGVLIPVKNITLDINAKMQNFGNIDKIQVDLYNGQSKAEDSAKITATTIGANVRVAI